MLGEELLNTLINRIAHVKRVICVVNPKAIYIWLWKYSLVLIRNIFLEVFTPNKLMSLVGREAGDDIIILSNEPSTVLSLLQEFKEH